MKNIKYYKSVQLTLMSVFIIFLCACSTSSGDKKNDNFIDIQWMPLTAKQNYLNDVLAAADTYNVQGMQLSHQIIHTIDEIVYPKTNRRMISGKVDIELLNNFIQQCKEKNYGTHVWTHEIVTPPEHTVVNDKVIIDHPDLIKHLKFKYDTALQIAPNINTFILTLFETEYRAYIDDQATTLEAENTAANRSKILINTMYEVSEENYVDLVVRGFRGSDQVFPELDKKIKLMCKNTETDWHPFSPFNDFITKNAGERTLWVEFDLGYEYELRNTVPYGQPVDVLNRLKRAYNNGVRTFAIRLDRYGGHEKASAIYTPWGQLGLEIFTRFSKDTTITANQIIHEWEQKHFKGAYELMQLSTKVTQTFLFPKKMWYADHSRPPAYDYARRHILPDDGYGPAQQFAENSHVPAKLAEQYLHNCFRSDKPDPEWYESIKNDLAENDPRIKRINEILDKNKAYIANNPVWQEACDRLEIWNKLFTMHQHIYFGIRLLENHPHALEKQELVDLMNDYKAEIEYIRITLTGQEGAHAGAMLWNQEKAIKSLEDKINSL